MNNKIKLAVAGAVLSAASVANAGIIIPAGEWTIDINGNVNAFYTRTEVDSNDTLSGTVGINEDGNGEDVSHGMTTGLLPSWLGFTGTTRQNDLDVSFTISFQTGVADHGIHGDGSDGVANNTTRADSLGEGRANVLNRQTFVTFGDKSWGSVKLGKDLGIYASDAILNDMTLLGVGAGSAHTGSTQNTTFGGIGTGYQYAAWKGQIAYTTPNMNGFQATVGIVDPNMFPVQSNDTYQDRMGFEAKASYSWSGDVAGKVWVSGASYDVTGSSALTHAAARNDDVTISAYDIGANVNIGNLGLTAYAYDGKGNGITALGLEGNVSTATGLKRRDGNGGYVQATYVIPTGTKLGLAYGVSNLDKASGEADGTLVDSQERWTVAAYHPLTKHLNLVAEYNDIKREGHNSALENEYDSISLGAILFF
jgi:predicted porin